MRITSAARRLAPWAPAMVAAGLVLGALLAEGADDGPGGFLAMLLAGSALALARRLPWWSLAPAAAGAVSAAVVAPNSGWYTMLLALAAAMLAAYSTRTLRGAALLGIPVGVVAGLVIGGWGGSASAAFISWTFVMILWGCAIGARALRDAVRAEQAKEQAVARTTVVESELRDERLRADLTHDFHDVMAHSLAVLAAQAEGLRLSHRAHPERIDPVLTTISDTARLALVEVRQLLERVDDDARRPQPTSADIPALVAQLRSAGPAVTLHDVGAHGHLSAVADIAAYRIVQESLTNALRHGGADVDIVVTLTWTGPGLSFAVSSPIRDRAALGPAGRGIAGMHERARLAGGALEIDAEGERFVVSGHLPYSPVSADPTAPLTEEQLFTLPVPTRPRPEDVVAPWIVARWGADARPGRPDPADPTPPTGWSLATTVDLTAGRLPDGRIPNPAAEPAAEPEAP
ncbi:sensor histidine kinase [Agrococcus carbonis]|nr:histidine kinase [Agrococcus carbonis]